MLNLFDSVLDSASVLHYRARLDSATWIDGRATAGSLSRSVKQNQQLDSQSDLAIELGNDLLRRLGKHAPFLSAALPEQIHPPRFNRYRDGGHYGTHVDSAIMRIREQGVTLRSDLSATVFLSEPDDYDGGELMIETSFGAQAVKLPAGSMVLYPSSSLHRVTPVTRGERVAAFFWIQSLVRDDGERALLCDLDRTIQSLSAQLPLDHPDVLGLSGTYHNLLRRWAQP